MLGSHAWFGGLKREQAAVGSDLLTVWRKDRVEAGGTVQGKQLSVRSPASEHLHVRRLVAHMCIPSCSGCVAHECTACTRLKRGGSICCVAHQPINLLPGRRSCCCLRLATSRMRC